MRADLGAGSNQRAHRLHVALAGREHQCGLAAIALGGMNVRSVGKQCVDGRGLAVQRRAHERRLTLARARVRIGTRGEQALDDLAVAVVGGELERRDAEAVHRGG
jgi:hypothetical protein